MKEISLEELNTKLAIVQENNNDDIQIILNDTANLILELVQFEITDNVFIAICDELLSFFIGELTDNKLVKNIIKLFSQYEKVDDNVSELINNIISNVSTKVNKVEKKQHKKGTIPVEELNKLDAKISNREDKETRVRNKKIKEKLLQSSQFTLNASSIDSKYYYVYVPSSENENDIIIERGIYYSTVSGSPKILTDCYIFVLNVVTTSTDSTNKHFIYKLRIVNKNDETFEGTITSHELKIGKLFEMLEHCKASSPPSMYLEKLLIHAIQQLAHNTSVLHQTEIDTLGYHLTTVGEKVYVLTNGVETKNGFISLDQSPFISPTIPPYANGYKGNNINIINDEILDLIFNRLNTNTDVRIIMLSLLGLSSIVCYPVGDYDGTINFATEIIGQNGHGKTPLTNFMLSFFGIDFNYQKGTLFNNTISDGDTKKMRGELIGKVKYVLFSDYDNKDTPNTGKSFEKIYEARNQINAAISDNAGRGYLSITRESRYVNSSKGGLIRTGNYDYALVSLQRDNLPVEKRTCTFVWPINERNNHNISVIINNRREEYYAIGNSYRKWILSFSDNELLNIFNEDKEITIKLVDSFEWISDNAYKNHCICIIVGLLLFKRFLQQYLPNTFMLQWIDEYIPLLIQNRIERAKFIFGGMQEQLKTEMLQNILTAISIRFASGEMYVNTQQDTAFKQSSKDIPYCGLDNLGYRNNRQGKVLVGYVVSNGQYIAFKQDRLFNQIQKYGKENNIDFVNQKNIEEILTRGNLVQLNKDNRRLPVKIKNSTLYSLITIPLSAIYPDCGELDETDRDTKNEEEIDHDLDAMVAEILASGEL